jgi:inosine/xanthosine triphosphatase
MASSILLPDVRRVVVGSENPVKVGAVRAVLGQCTTSVVVYGVPVTSGVPDQPWGDTQTRAGALARARAAMLTDPAADMAVGLEGGVVREADGSVRTCAWAAIIDRQGSVGVGGSLAMPLPPAVVALLDGGMELGHAMDMIVQACNIKQGRGAVGVLTGNLITRQQAYEPLVTYALARWIAADLWTGAAPTA